jgi:hypothetical protein
MIRTGESTIPGDPARRGAEDSGGDEGMTPTITKRRVLSVGVLGLALSAMLSVGAQAAERVVLAEYFTSNY